jgi:pimeloyl-ACP methyl ester carboxylesterase
VALGAMAQALVEKGCRVLVMELWGRGYSDNVNLPHDSRLYATEILIAITSSPLAWTPEGFSLVGYSLGGGICADFAVSFPDMIRGVVLLAPGGMLRPHHISTQGRFIYSGIIPERFLRRIVRRRLGVASTSEDSQTPHDPGMAAVGEEIRGTGSSQSTSPLLSPTRPHVTAAGAVKWQLDSHEGFVSSFVSSMQNASIARTEETIKAWKKLGKRKDKVIIVVGKSDPIVYVFFLGHIKSLNISTLTCRPRR